MNLVALFLPLLLAVAEPLPTAAPRDVGMDPAILQEAMDAVRSAVASDDIKGGVALVARAGRVVAFEAVGWRDEAATRPFEKDTLFRMASNTKPVVAAAVLALAEDGRLRLDDPVARHLPAFAAGDSAKITVAQLLSHTSGLRIEGLFLSPPLDEPSLRAEVDRFAAVGPAVGPGTTYAYSNAGYNTLGAVVEAVSGLPLETFLKERFYVPLSMDDTSHRETGPNADRMAAVQRKRDGAWVVQWRPGDPPTVPFTRASGGLVSTAGDYLRFLQMFLDEGVGGGRRILTARSVREATRPQTRSLYDEEEAARRPEFYGYGWSVAADGRYSHGGSDGTYAWVDPARALIGILFTQSPGDRELVDRFRDRVTAACVADPPAPEVSKLNANFLDPDLKVEEWIERFEGESREIARHRDEITAALGLERGDAVADIGAGTGLYTGPFAQAVGPEGRVYAVDISAAFVDHLRERAAEQGLGQVVPVLCSERSTALPPASIDAAFICDTYHHFSHPADTLASLHAAMRPGGRLVVVDFRREPNVSRPWVLDHVRAGKEVFRAEIEGAGFVFEDEVEIEGMEENYVLRFRRP